MSLSKTGLVVPNRSRMFGDGSAIAFALLAVMFLVSFVQVVNHHATSADVNVDAATMST